MAHHKRRRPRTRGVGKSDWKALDRKLRARGETGDVNLTACGRAGR